MTYYCCMANKEQMLVKWQEEISRHPHDPNWVRWKDESLDAFEKGQRQSYYDILNGTIITEPTAVFSPKGIQNAQDLIDQKKAYLMAFRTIPEEEGKGYFSTLVQFMLDDLKARGHTSVSLGVEPSEIRNKTIYQKWGFTRLIKTGMEYYHPSDKIGIEVEYYETDLI
ncbi:GNAT family N-acetyltransferase [Streptococcus catagoni]|uniref:GNAT family N-acetyltransferase n=1 Tax=Streptococcus catagoni TaxID=2654874 RepID=UPI00140BE70D|nr:GNAT family N-acetyltransferase [Streptococcus catagoni]